MKEQILKAIEQYDTIIIHRHVRPDPDALGSQGGLAQMIKASYPHKKVYTVGEEEPSLQFMLTMDDVSDDIYEEALVIACDTANQERISDERYKNGKMLIKIDHHPNVDAYGDIAWVETTASSTSEMIYELFAYGKDKGILLNDEGARLLYAGIVGDTGRFLFPSTTPKTFRIAAELIQYDFYFPTIYDEMYKTDIRVARLNGYIMQHFAFTDEKIGYMKITKELLEEFRLTPNEASQTVGSLGNIDGIKAWVLFFEEAEKIRVRLRSKGVVINELAANYNGGGHPLASGATVYSWEEAGALIEDLCKLAREANR